mgnify:FL=1
MTKNMIYLLFKDGEEVEVKEEVATETETKEETKVEEKEEQPKEEKTKKETKKTEKKVSITAKEFEEYKQFKLNSMSAEERENALKEENESLLTKIGILENTIETQTKEIERVKAQDSIKDKLNSLKTEKPYLTETIDKRVNKGFNSLDEVNEFVNLVDSATLKEAYEVLQRTQKATKVTGNTVVNGNGNTVVRNDTDRPVDLTKYGILKK